MELATYQVVRAGYWVALLFVGAAGILLVVVRFAERRRERRRIWPSVAGAVLMALPTVVRPRGRRIVNEARV